jgi:hypothetical protein
MSVVDDAVVAHLGFFRDPETLAAVPYYANLPDDLSSTSPVFALDPMLATGHSGAAALDVLAARGATRTCACCARSRRRLGSSPICSTSHPGVRIVTCAIDQRLNEHGYIVPGLGDAGDRMFGSATSLPAAYRDSGEPAARHQGSSAVPRNAPRCDPSWDEYFMQVGEDRRDARDLPARERGRGARARAAHPDDRL